MIKFTEWLKEHHPGYFIEADVSRRSFLGSAGAGIAGLMGLSGSSKAAPPPPRPQVPVVSAPVLDKLEDKNIVPVTIKLTTTGNTIQDSHAVYKAIEVSALRKIERRVDEYVRDSGARIGKWQAMSQNRPVRSTRDVASLIRYPTKTTKQGGEIPDYTAGNEAVADLDIHIIYIDNDGKVIPNIERWLQSKIMMK